MLIILTTLMLIFVTWYTFRVDQKRDPADDDKEAGWEIISDHIEGHLASQNQLKTSNAVMEDIRF